MPSLAPSVRLSLICLFICLFFYLFCLIFALYSKAVSHFKVVGQLLIAYIIIWSGRIMSRQEFPSQLSFILDSSKHMPACIGIFDHTHPKHMPPHTPDTYRQSLSFILQISNQEFLFCTQNLYIPKYIKQFLKIQ
jgi:hypothetical protein